ncbi:RNA polymerase factor sigma-54 [Paenibacillus sp. N1-5-1-14]|uniref:RNA polymerase factor sigma-54 n=1 Tax=Paenibacillus radicibacter TaxID=2972488 RepID=UPI002158CA3D|nr:RNA polymerase factor sigma-54 [Paenibacillus radicibacter]MCR8644792.1 RNA polymerase factor sigma-54 [Paenibacillus radicibacter]
MNMTYSLSQEQHIKLYMTPELKQSIHILQLSSAELNAYVQERASENPLIEVEWKQDPFSIKSKRFNEKYSHLDSLGSLAVHVDTLEDWIMQQLRMTSYNLAEFKAISYFAGNLNDAGYLAITVEETAKALHLTYDDVENALAKLHTFDPAGIGGRDLQECLTIQIKRDEDAPVGALEVVTYYLSELAKGKYDKISKELDINEKNMPKILDYIRTLNPRPGLGYGRHEKENIVVDAEVSFANNNLVIEMKRSTCSKVTINREYVDLVKSAQGEEVASYIQDQMKSAQWLIRSLEYRNDTLFKVIYAIVQEQMAFFEGEDGNLRPMNLRHLSDTLSIHESTVSRAIKNKFIDTPRGIYELKYFFSNGIQTAKGEDISSRAVKSTIRAYIHEEDKRKPLSDQIIANMLQKSGIEISRRTVAKYREEEKILSSSLRKMKAI